MATITLQNVPEELVQRLKKQAAEHRRSLNQEAIAQLQAGVMLRSDEEVDRLTEKVRAARERMREEGVWLDPALVRGFIEEGRL